MCTRIYKSFLVILLLHFSVVVSADVTDSIIHVSKLKGRVYQLLEQISSTTRKMFIYDSDIIDNTHKAKIDAGDYPLVKVVRTITGRNDIELKSIGNHILINVVRPLKIRRQKANSSSAHIAIEGRIVDNSTHQPLGYASVGIKGTSIGSVANGDGHFRIIISDTLANSEMTFSCLGYQTKVMPVSLLRQECCTIYLQEYITTLQEIVARMTNPDKILSEMRSHQKNNYYTTPVSATTFYREGTECNGRFAKFCEGVFRIYKPSILSGESERVKLLKMRNMTRSDGKDTIVAKMKAGIEGCLMLDLIKHTPDFLEKGNTDYNYFSTGITTVDDHTVNIIYFEQKKEVGVPLFCGELFIDSENYALLGANFEINPEHIRAAADMFIEKKSFGVDITPLKISYSVTYKKNGNHYSVNYVRGDLLFKAKVKRHLFGTSKIHLWMEMATCDIDTAGVVKFDKSEQLAKSSVFEDTHFVYDRDFWEDFNSIPIDKNIIESISKIALNIEEKLSK